MLRNSHWLSRFWIVLLVAVLLSVTACAAQNESDGQRLPDSINSANSQFNDQSNLLKVYFLDVGQADSILIQLPNQQTMLIDAGNNDDGTWLVNYLKQVGITHINYLIGTHPHEDHIGGMDLVIDNFTVDKMYMPQVTHNTKTFEDTLKAASNQGLKITTAKAGLQIINEDNLKVVMLAPHDEQYKDLNNYSAVVKLSFGQVNFLFTGDAEKISEANMLAENISLKADVLKVGHHGSESSTTKEFLQAITPQYAVICCGTDNDYGHPHQVILDRLQQQGVKVYRTDIQGTITMVTDGKALEINTDKNSETVSSEADTGIAELPTNPGQVGKIVESGKTTSQSADAAKVQVEPAKESPDAATENDIGAAPTTASETEEIYTDEHGQGLIKGNINSKGEKIYHMPNGPYYKKTTPEMWFKTEAEAVAAGFRPIKQ